ncbi:MAG: hypothetical protein K2N61_00075 [Lachnospiraceae bacterium]|nr:hypothetical protein [Lachnospiraceae bacterium]
MLVSSFDEYSFCLMSLFGEQNFCFVLLLLLGQFEQADLLQMKQDKKLFKMVQAERH